MWRCNPNPALQIEDQEYIHFQTGETAKVEQTAKSVWQLPSTLPPVSSRCGCLQPYPLFTCINSVCPYSYPRWGIVGGECNAAMRTVVQHTFDTLSLTLTLI